jgi:hypothetical protein
VSAFNYSTRKNLDFEPTASETGLWAMVANGAVRNPQGDVHIKIYSEERT